MNTHKNTKNNMIPKTIMTMIVALFISVPAYSAGCEYGNVNDCTEKAEQGDAFAKAQLGLMYDDGIGVVKDYKQAVYWYRKSAGQGNSLAQNMLGYMYRNGKGVVKDYKQAVYWYRKSAEQGNAPAQNMLGIMYDDGIGVAKDYVMAYMYYNIASMRYEEAVEYRGILEKKMTASQIEKAQEMFRQWLKKYNKK